MIQRVAKTHQREEICSNKKSEISSQVIIYLSQWVLIHVLGRFGTRRLGVSSRKWTTGIIS